MVEISNIGPLGDNNGGNGSKKTDEKKSTEVRTSAFDDYKEHKRKAEQEFNDFRNEANSNYESFRNKAERKYEDFRQRVMGKFEQTVNSHTPSDETIKNPPKSRRDEINENYAKALADPNNWEVLTLHEGIKSPLVDKPKTPPVYNPEQSEATRTPEKVEDTKPTTEVVNNTQPEAVNQKKPQQVPMNIISRDGVIGKYRITPGSNGEGFSLATNMSVSGGGEAKEFFRLNGNKGNEIHYNKDNKRYTFRGIQSHDMSFLQSRMTMASQSVSINNAIYNDLLQKQKNGVELSDAEKSFIKYHLENIDRYGLSVDNEGNLINKSE